MSLSTQAYKGARDFYPEDKRLQNYIFSTFRSVAERFGYEEYDAPILENIELYKAKSGEEIVNEQTYTFRDRGDREVVIRPEMTPSVSRLVAGRRQELGYPLRWYSIPVLWRYERPQRGRLREHWQLNVDIFGIENNQAEHELILLADCIMNQFGAQQSMYKFNLNHRGLMDYIFDSYLGLNSEQAHKIAKLIDKMNKISPEDFASALKDCLDQSQLSDQLDQKLVDVLQTEQIADLPSEVADSQPAKELQDLLGSLKDSGLENVNFDISIMRGFDYYTGIVFEMNDTDPDNPRAIMGGGRYDGLVGLFGVEPIATVGFGWGDVTLGDFLTTHKLLPTVASQTDIYAVLVGDVYSQAQSLIADLRSQGLKIAVDSTDRKIPAKIKTALKKDIKYALFIGPEEIEQNKFNLKNLQSQQEQKLSPQEIVSTIQGTV
jgi:histidyl-tRNA synthetase